MRIKIINNWFDILIIKFFFKIGIVVYKDFFFVIYWYNLNLIKL